VVTGFASDRAPNKNLISPLTGRPGLTIFPVMNGLIAFFGICREIIR